jgi:hypothetical protein
VVVLVGTDVVVVGTLVVVVGTTLVVVVVVPPAHSNFTASAIT